MKSKRWSLLALLALDGFLPQSNAGLYLGSAANFAVLGASTVTSTGDTVLNGNLGVYSGTAITGFPPGIVNGTIYAGGGTVAEVSSIYPPSIRYEFNRTAITMSAPKAWARDTGTGLTRPPSISQPSSSCRAGLRTPGTPIEARTARPIGPF